MAGMFYSLDEAIAKLNMTQEQLKDLVREGKLREFRDGSNVLFKVDEVDALTPDLSSIAFEESAAMPEGAAGKDEISLVPEAVAPETAVPEPVVPEPAVPETAVPEPIVPEPAAPEPVPPETAIPEAVPPEAVVPEIAMPEAVAGETTEDTGARDELTDADTVVADEGINVLGETGGDEAVDDLLTETKGTTGEASLEEIEEDVNLDTFGSGSGLLDLSLQADDTSLGGILDEIYTSESEEGEETREGSALEAAVEGEQMLAEDEFAAPGPTPVAPVAAQGYIEPAPDTVSNAFGIVLFLPLLIIVYTAIVTVAGFNDAMPVVRERIQGIIWYVMAGVAVAAGLIVGAAFMLTGGGGQKTKKPKARKPKRAKKKARPAPEG
jgi:hypothetical protein